jgi:hypothetical protein
MQRYGAVEFSGCNKRSINLEFEFEFILIEVTGLPWKSDIVVPASLHQHYLLLATRVIRLGVKPV